MQLSDRDIKRELRAGSLKIDPLEDWNSQIQPASVDLRLAPELIVFWEGYAEHPDYPESEDGKRAFSITGKFRVERGMFIIASTVERCSLPENLSGRVEGKSTLGRSGLSIHSTAGFIDPGFSGTITLEMDCKHPGGVILTPGMKIAQIAFYRMESPAERPYGHSSRQSKYQGQEGPTEAREEAPEKVPAFIPRHWE